MAVSLNTKFEKGATGQTSPFAFTSNAGTTSGTIAANANRVLIGYAAFNGVTPSAVAMTWNGSSMTALGSVLTAGSTTLYLFYMFAPASGANSLSVSWTGGSSQVVLGAVCFDGADQVSPPVDGGNADTGTGTSGSSVVTTNSGDAACAVSYNNNGTSTTLSAGTQDWLDTSLPQGNYGMAHVLSSGSTATITWTWTGSQVWGNRKVNVPQVSASTYTLSGATGAFVLTGNNASLNYYSLGGEAGSFLLTGKNAVLGWQGVVATGRAPLAYFDPTMILAGWFDPDTSKLTAQFDRTWADVSGTTSYTLTALTGTFTVTGGNAQLDWAHKLAGATGVFTVTGNNAQLRKGYVLDGAAGAFALTGGNAQLDWTHNLAAATGVFNLTGNNATLTYAPVIKAILGDTGVFLVTGNNAQLDWNHDLLAASGSFAVTGGNATMRVGRVLDAGTGAFTVTGGNANLSWTHNLTAGTGVFIVTGYDATLTYTPHVSSYFLLGETGVFIFTGYDATLTKFPPEPPTPPSGGPSKGWVSLGGAGGGARRDYRFTRHLRPSDLMNERDQMVEQEEVMQVLNVIIATLL